MSRPKAQLAYISIPASQLAAGVDTFVKLPFTADFIFLPPTLPAPGTNAGYVANGDGTAVYAVRLNDASAPRLMFGTNIDAQPFAVIEATVDSFYITRLDTGGTVLPLQLIVGTDCDLGTLAGVY